MSSTLFLTVVLCAAAPDGRHSGPWRETSQSDACRAAAPAGRMPADLREWRTAIAAALRAEATSRTAEDRGTAIRRLLELAKSLQQPAGVSRADAVSLARPIHARLRRIHAEATAQRRRDAIPARVAPERPGVLAQVAPGGAGPGAAPDRRAIGDDLVELIEATIAPETWTNRGGNGVIVFWANGHALVVRQTDDEHFNLAGLIQQFQP